MPAGDRTGPMGMGPMTGRGVGYCGGYEAPGWANWGPGRRFFGPGGRWGGYRAGRGGGWQWRHWFYASGQPRWVGWETLPAGVYGAPYAAPSREQEIEMLRGEAEWLRDQLDAISRRMEELSQE
jgi:Family of unknown function (DUF5320)